MTPKVLFNYQMGAAAGPTEISAGPASGKVWVIKNIRCANQGATGSLLLTQHLGAVDVVILPAQNVSAIGDVVLVENIVVENGQTIDATTATASSTFDIVAYGYEMDV